MKLTLTRRLTALATIALTSLISVNSTKAATFEETKVEQSNVIAVARPYGDNKYDLLVIQQIPGKQACWSENGSNPVTVDPLLLNFDFTGICNRATDSNGYSIRIAGQDYGLDYMLRIVERNGELVLVGTNRVNPSQEIIVGRTKGMASGFLKIQLEPGWEFSKRTYNGKVLGHFYFSGNETALANLNTSNPAAIVANNSSVAQVNRREQASVPDSTTNTSNIVFKDLNNDIYQTEIEKAVALGFIAGFKEDNTFRPNAPLTREQLVSMAIEAMSTIEEIDINETPTRSVQPFSDVDQNRWSAKKITWAQWNQIIAGNPNGTFQPTEPITRAELMAVLRRVAEYIQNQQGQSPELRITKTPRQFSDLEGHWADQLVTQMSGYCQIASPLNEQGDQFAPNQPAQRNYAAAAMVRMLNCLATETQAHR